MAPRRSAGEEHTMGRPPLPPATAGKTRCTRSGKNWIARCEFRDYNGVIRSIQRARPAKKAAQQALKQALKDRLHRNDDAVINPGSTLRVAVETWWEGYAAGEGSLGSKLTYRQIIDNHLLPTLGDTKCRAFSVAAAERFLRHVEQRHGRPQAKTARTVLSNVCGYAARLGAMTHNPVRDTSRLRNKPKHRPTALNAAEVRQLRAYVTYFPPAVRRDVPAVIDLLAASGLRIGECLALTVDALDLKRHTVQVRGTVARYSGVGVAISRKPKTESGHRTLTLPDWVWPTVEAHVYSAVSLAVRVFAIDEALEFAVPTAVPKPGRPRGRPPTWLQELMERGESWEEEITIIFPSMTGSLRDPCSASHDLKAALTFAGLSHATSHLLRKCVATQMDDTHVPVREIADQLGHSRPSMTQDVYLDRKPVCTAAATALKPFGFLQEPPGT
jgi:integrase